MSDRNSLVVRLKLSSRALRRVAGMPEDTDRNMSQKRKASELGDTVKGEEGTPRIMEEQLLIGATDLTKIVVDSGAKGRTYYLPSRISAAISPDLAARINPLGLPVNGTVHYPNLSDVCFSAFLEYLRTGTWSETTDSNLKRHFKAQFPPSAAHTVAFLVGAHSWIIGETLGSKEYKNFIMKCLPNRWKRNAGLQSHIITKADVVLAYDISPSGSKLRKLAADAYGLRLKNDPGNMFAKVDQLKELHAKGDGIADIVEAVIRSHEGGAPPYERIEEYLEE